MNRITGLLFPHRFKRLGLFLLIPGLVVGFYALMTSTEPNVFKWPVLSFFDEELINFNGEGFQWVAVIWDNVLLELCGLLIIVGGIFVGFSREPEEDEYIAKLRWESLVWATYVNYIVLALAILFIYKGTFLYVMIFNMFTVLLFFIIRFNWVLRAMKKNMSPES